MIDFFIFEKLSNLTEHTLSGLRPTTFIVELAYSKHNDRPDSLIYLNLYNVSVLVIM